MTAHAEPVLEDWGQLISFSPSLVLRPTSMEDLDISALPSTMDFDPGDAVRSGP